MNTASALRLETRPDGVAVLLFDQPGASVNTLSRSFFADFASALDRIAADPAIRACVLASAKPDSFIAGANLHEILAMATPEEGARLSREGHALLDRLEQSPKPFVAAIHGPALGGGLEVALACRYRIASDDPKTQLGLPEVMVGLLPAGGGTQRLPRLIGLEKALPMLLTGSRIRAKKAYKFGLVDALTGPHGLVDTAAKAALRLADGTLTVRRGEPKTASDKLLSFGAARRFVYGRARADVLKKTRGLYPAPKAILECVEIGLERGLAPGYAAEERLFGQLVVSPEAKAMIWLFDAMTGLKKAPDAELARPIRRWGVLGSGLMGQGIASVSLGLGPVVVKDVSDAALGRAAKGMHEGLAKRVKSGGLTAIERDRQWARLRFTTDYTGFKGCDLVIEAVFEDLALKQQVLADCEAVLDPQAVFASNTSALPIHQIAAQARHPERVLGMHYFSPVPKMPLLEIVVTPQTAPWAIATARAAGIAQGKTVIVVQDGPGFYTTRILAPYLDEASRLVAEGAEIAALDRALKDFGFPVGPIALIDEVGLDVGAHVAADLGQAFAERGMGGSSAVPAMVEAGFLGRKNGKGFYRYDAGAGEKPVNTEVYRFFGGAERRPIPAAQMAERLALLMVNEAAYCLQEGVIGSPLDGDIGAILGLGFPPFRGGPFHHADAVGVGALVARMEALAAQHGPRFRPAPLLVEMAQTGRRFYEPVAAAAQPV